LQRWTRLSGPGLRPPVAQAPVAALAPLVIVHLVASRGGRPDPEQRRRTRPEPTARIALADTGMVR